MEKYKLLWRKIGTDRKVQLKEKKIYEMEAPVSKMTVRKAYFSTKEELRIIFHGLGLFKPDNQWTIGQLGMAAAIVKK